MAKNKNLTQAKIKKDSEWYTLISDVEKELKHYKKYFEGKVVYCNCDDPEESNFWKFFELNFEEYKLKKLISTHYDAEKPTYKLELSADIDGDGKITKGDIVKTPLKQNGDFRSEESINLLKESDIVVTNPPFSLEGPEYIPQLMKYKKKFLIIGNENLISNIGPFNYLRSNEMWLGYNHIQNFKQPDGSIKKFGNIVWYTNLPVKNRNEDLILTQKYDPSKYPKYENYNAIHIDKVANIPKDYNGVMGVPITFMNKHNPKQFKILGLMHTGEKNVDYLRTDFSKRHRGVLNGKEKYARILIQKINENNTNENIG